jgi:hypothetical protein
MKGTPNSDGSCAPFDFGTLTVSDEGDGDLIGVVHVADHGDGWTVSFTDYGIACDGRARAEDLGEVVAGLLPGWRAILLAERDRLLAARQI